MRRMRRISRHSLQKGLPFVSSFGLFHDLVPPRAATRVYNYQEKRQECRFPEGGHPLWAQIGLADGDAPGQQKCESYGRYQNFHVVLLMRLQVLPWNRLRYDTLFIVKVQAVLGSYAVDFNLLRAQGRVW